MQRATYELRKRLMTGCASWSCRCGRSSDRCCTTRRRSDRGELAERYQDLYDHVLRATEWADSLRDLVTTIFETNLSLADARLNQVVKKLSAWAAIIAVPTAVTGFYGQNVPYPGFGAGVRLRDQHGGDGAARRRRLAAASSGKGWL